jgi:hypothetical protein
MAAVNDAVANISAHLLITIPVQAYLWMFTAVVDTTGDTAGYNLGISMT